MDCRRRRFVSDFGVSFENLFETAHRRAAALDQRKHPTKRCRGPRQHVEIGDKRDNIGDQQVSPHHPNAAVPDHDQHRQTVDALHDRVDDAAHLRHLHAFDFVVLIQSDELLGLEILLRVSFHDMHAA